METTVKMEKKDIQIGQATQPFYDLMYYLEKHYPKYKWAINIKHFNSFYGMISPGEYESIFRNIRCDISCDYNFLYKMIETYDDSNYRELGRRIEQHIDFFKKNLQVGGEKWIEGWIKNSTDGNNSSDHTG